MKPKGPFLTRNKITGYAGDSTLTNKTFFAVRPNFFFMLHNAIAYLSVYIRALCEPELLLSVSNLENPAVDFISSRLSGKPHIHSFAPN